jgi:hypothetical protein
VPSDSAAATASEDSEGSRRPPSWPTHYGGYEDETFNERFLGPSANGFISSKAALKRQCGVQTAERSIYSGTPSWVT